MRIKLLILLTITGLITLGYFLRGKIKPPVKIGLELDESTGDFFFADIIEGRVYWVRGVK